MKQIQYRAIAGHDGRIGALLVTRLMGDTPGQAISKRQEWTGQTWPDTAAGRKAAMAWTAEGNCAR